MIRNAHAENYEFVSFPEMRTSAITMQGVKVKTSPSKMEETRMLTRETIFTGDNQKCLEVPF